MLHIDLRRRTRTLSLTILTALALGGCSSDTRAILAPSDASIQLVAASPLIANESVEVTVTATKGDGTPVADGTEIELSASDGEFDAPRVRTQGGQAATVYRAGGTTGPVELLAASDTVQAQVTLIAASAAVARVVLNASPNQLPIGGGEVEVRAIVLSATGEPVVNAPVEILTPNGSLTPGGPVLTDSQGQVTIRMSASQATQVRARVFGIEAGVDIGVQTRRENGDDPRIDTSDVVWLHADAGDWEVTSEITDIRIDHDTICIEHTKAGRWPRRNGGEGNPWIFANIDGQWYAATYEYLRSGQTCKHITRRGDWGIGPHTKRPPLEGWAPRKGELVGFMVSTFARDSTRTSNQRSNIVMLEWPY